jgi:hypothetical protein
MYFGFEIGDVEDADSQAVWLTGSGTPESAVRRPVVPPTRSPG